MKRREFVALLGAAPALVGLTRKFPPRVAGSFVDDNGAAGHRVRDGVGRAAGGPAERVPIVIVGGGIAGLSAAWELGRRGMRDFVLLEMERVTGGNSRWGENDVSRFPWAAHYVPVPGKETTLARELFEELGILRDGVWEERFLCFSPQERLFQHGQWQEGIVPDYAMNSAEHAALRRFDDEIARARATGQFTIPMVHGAPEQSPLDATSMLDWLRARQLDVPALRWYVDYACRDDYGALASETSAWAGIHYFASRQQDEKSPLTWPEGNGWIARQLAAKCAAQTRTGEPVHRIERDGHRWRVSTPARTYLADTVIFAAPTFTAPYVVAELRGQQVPLVYSPWMTANLTLERWPASHGARGAPFAWDNVIYDSPSLGYVVATHQSLATAQDRTVWTYYWALAQMTPAAGRALLQRRSWTEWTDIILADLARAHPDIRDCVSRIDIMRLGHAMVRPTVGFLTRTRETRERTLPGLYWANSDLSGLSLFEEAQYRGVTAARSALARVSR